MDNNIELKKYFSDRNIEAVAFDVDNTLFSTNEYYTEAVINLGLKLSKYLQTDKSSLDISKELLEGVSRLYENGRYRPKLIEDICLEAISIKFVNPVPAEILDFVKNEFKNFYMISPALYDSSISVLRAITSLGLKIVLHSHAQEEWTKIKVSLLENELHENIPYLATDISSEKNFESWIDASNLININIKNILVVGDNLYSDIFPAMEAGCEYVVWLNNRKEDIPSKKSANMVIIHDISEILFLNKF